MKKKGLILLFAGVCLLTVGCGKDDEEKSEKKASSDVKVLTCTQEEGDQKATITLEQNKKTYEITKAKMSMTVDKSIYDGFVDSDEQLKELVCKDEDEELKSCDVKFDGNMMTVNLEYEPKKYGEDLVEDDEDLEKLDADTLTKLKEEAEEEGATCTIK